MPEKISKRFPSVRFRKYSSISVEFENFDFSREQSLKSTKVLVKLQHVMKSKVLSSRNIENFNKIHKFMPAKFKGTKVKTLDTQTMDSHMGPILDITKATPKMDIKDTHIMAHISNMDAKTCKLQIKFSLGVV